ncbi:hypothetical protein C6P46_000074 [Rhodotorula mucilaginosa]|uniref:Uncharacterized protein n=1 Tax=Rhodotorula mucilaginosa TaxID=5537 RepID=A0A9P7BA85_RHOMI|nr:hypothetical protein C6P46_000074 [Rhodotorula mucilaginosa]
MHWTHEPSLASVSSADTRSLPTAQLPPELLLKIIHATLTTALLSAPLVVHGQFSQLPVTCSGCVYRRLACVSRLWRSLAREVRCQDVVLAAAGGCGSAERDAQVLQRLEAEPTRALGVRTIDASLRGAHGGWIPVPAPSVRDDGGETDDGISGTEAGASGVTTAQARWERWHEQCMARERVRFLRIVSLCTQLTTIDIDVGFFHDVATTHANVLPTSIRKLTLRNADAVETFTILRALPRVEHLTLRLALDWRLPLDGRGVDSTDLPSLRHFELSTTAFGTPCADSIRALLVAADVMQEAAPRLEELAIMDLPRHRGLSRGDPAADASWWPSKTLQLPRLCRLHLAGLALPDSGFFTRTIALPNQQLEELIVEDFDTLSLTPLIHALESVPALQSLQQLAIAVSREGEIARCDSEGWRRQQRRIEDW